MVLSSSLAARPVEGVTEKVSDWKPVINPAISYTLDSRPMEGITYLERSALGVSLDSGPTERGSCLEPLEQWVFSSSLAARPVEGVAEKVSDWKPVINPVQDINPDGRPMEGTAYLEHSSLGVSLDSGLMEGMLCMEPLDQSVLGVLSVGRPEETDMPERPALASQTHHEQACFTLSARLMPDTDIVHNTDVSTDKNTDLPENSAPMIISDWSLFKWNTQPYTPVQDTQGGRPMEGITEPLKEGLSGHSLAVDCTSEEHLPTLYSLGQSDSIISGSQDYFKNTEGTQFGYDTRHSSPELEDAIRREVLRNRSMRYMSSREVNGPLLLPEQVNLSDVEISLDQVRSEGLRQWNMDMDIEYQYETFNGLPVYYGGDMSDSEDTEEHAIYSTPPGWR